jgi:hypothetical protein
MTGSTRMAGLVLCKVGLYAGMVRQVWEGSNLFVCLLLDYFEDCHMMRKLSPRSEGLPLSDVDRPLNWTCYDNCLSSIQVLALSAWMLM